MMEMACLSPIYASREVKTVDWVKYHYNIKAAANHEKKDNYHKLNDNKIQKLSSNITNTVNNCSKIIRLYPQQHFMLPEHTGLPIK